MAADAGAIDVVCIGETMALFRAEASGPLTHARAMTLGIGGSESNVAVGLTRLGARAAWVGGVGTDSLGELIVHELLGEGVEVVALRHPTAPTGVMIKERRTPATQQVTYYRSGSAGSAIRPEDLPVVLLQGTRILHLTGITPALSESAAETVIRAIDIAKHAGATVSFDINHRTALWRERDAGSDLRPLIADSDIVFAGPEEAAMVVGLGTPEEQADRLGALGPREVVIKQGAAGALALVDGRVYRQAAIPIQPVDTVGAGDAFVAGYLAELLAGEPADRRLLTAVRTGAFACLVPGDWEGFPRRADLGLLETSESVAR